MVCSVALVLFACVAAFAAQPEISKNEKLQLQASFFMTGTWIYVQIDAERADTTGEWEATLWASLTYTYGWGVGQNEAYLVQYVPIPSDTLLVRGDGAELHLDLNRIEGLFVEHRPSFEEPELGGAELLPGRNIDLVWQFGDLHHGAGGTIRTLFWSDDGRWSVSTRTLSERGAEPSGNVFGFAVESFGRHRGLTVEDKTMVSATPGTIPPEVSFPPNPALTPEP